MQTETGQWVCKRFQMLEAVVAQILINHKSSCGFFFLLVSYKSGL